MALKFGVDAGRYARVNNGWASRDGMILLRRYRVTRYDRPTGVGRTIEAWDVVIDDLPVCTALTFAAALRIAREACPCQA